MTSEQYELGMKIRREVNGDATVDSILANTDEFSQPIQDLVTKYAWGEIWGRPGLDRRSRSILNLGILAALNRPDALGGHVKAALANGVTPEEIQECLLQVAVYAGLPAGLASFAVAKKVLDEHSGA